jgi:hypothetical protein
MRLQTGCPHETLSAHDLPEPRCVVPAANLTPSRRQVRPTPRGRGRSSHPARASSTPLGMRHPAALVLDRFQPFVRSLGFASRRSPVRSRYAPLSGRPSFAGNSVLRIRHLACARHRNRCLASAVRAHCVLPRRKPPQSAAKEPVPSFVALRFAERAGIEARPDCR